MNLHRFAHHRCPAAVVALLVATATARAADADYLPDGTQLAVAVHMKQVFAAEVVKGQPDAVPDLKAVLGRFAGLDALDRYVRLAGIDVYRDASRVTVAFTGAADLRWDVAIVAGESVGAKLEAAAKNGTVVRVARAGSPTVYELAPRGEKPRYAVPVDGATLVVTATLPVAKANGQKDSSKSSGIGKEFARWEAAHALEPSLTVVARGSALARIVTAAGLPNADRAAAFLQGLEIVSGSVTLARGVAFQLSCPAESEDAARKLTNSANSAVKILLTYVRQTADKEPKYRPLVDVVARLQFIVQGTHITLRGDLSLDTIEKLIAAFTAVRPATERK